MKRILKNLVVIPLIYLLCFSCTEEIDFDEANQIKLTPELELDLAFFTLDADEIEDNPEGSFEVVKNITDVEFPSSSFPRDNIKKAQLFFKFINTLPRNFLIKVKFLKPDNSLAYQFNASVPSGSKRNPIIKTEIDLLNASKIRELFRATQIETTFVVNGTSDLDLIGSLIMQSKGTFFLEF